MTYIHFFFPDLFAVEQDPHIERLGSCTVGCLAGNTCASVLGYDGLLWLAHFTSTMRRMLDICQKYGVDHNLFNPELLLSLSPYIPAFVTTLAYNYYTNQYQTSTRRDGICHVLYTSTLIRIFHDCIRELKVTAYLIIYFCDPDS